MTIFLEQSSYSFISLFIVINSTTTLIYNQKKLNFDAIIIMMDIILMTQYIYMIIIIAAIN